MESIVLIGFMGAGKATIGQSLINKLKMSHLDLDTALIEKIGRSIPDYFEKYDEAAFREQETQLLKELPENATVLSTEGGIVVRLGNHSLLKPFQQVIHPYVTSRELLKRIKEDTENQRPLAIERSSKEIITLSESRKSFYEECAKMTTDMINRLPEEIINEILQQLKE